MLPPLYLTHPYREGGESSVFVTVVLGLCCMNEQRRFMKQNGYKKAPQWAGL